MIGTLKLRTLLGVAIACLSLAVSTGAHAGLIGTNASCAASDFNNNWSCDTASSTVTNPGNEFVIRWQAFFLQNLFNVDIGDNSLTLSLALNENIQLFDQGFLTIGLTGVTSIANFSSTGVGGLDLSDYTLNAGVLGINLDATQWVLGDSATITFGSGRETRVPEPASLALVALGLTAAAARRRRR